jgi:hypothetical protein
MQSPAFRLESKPFEWKCNPLESGERQRLANFLAAHPQPLSGYTVASLVSWDPTFSYRWAFPEPETLLISCTPGLSGERHFIQPLGLFSQAAQDRLIAEASSSGYPMRILGVCEEFLDRHKDFVRRFRVTEDPAASNYVYLAEDLAALPGRRYARKRNLISQASGLYVWTIEAIDPGNTGDCHEILQRIWEEEKPENNANLQQELSALALTLRLWSELGQDGILLKVKGRPAAFAIFEAIHPTTAAVHFERALRSYKGLYQVVNSETAKVIAARGFTYINREEDLGVPGLREAKHSYHPKKIITAYEIAIS